MTPQEFLESKIGHYNSTHPFLEKDVDYEDVQNWLSEYCQWWVAAWNMRDKQATEQSKLLKKCSAVLSTYNDEMATELKLQIDNFLKQ